MNAALRTFCTALVLVCFAGCATQPQPELYRLEAGINVAGGGDGPTLGLRPIALPEYLYRNSLTWLEENNGIEVSPNHLWAEPLDKGIQRVTELNLVGLLKARGLARYPWNPANAPDVVIDLVIVDLTASETSARLVANIGVGSTHTDLSSQLLTWTKPLDTEPDGATVAATFSDLLLTMAEEIARQVQALESETTAQLSVSKKTP